VGGANGDLGVFDVASQSWTTTSVALPAITGIWGSSDSDVWFAGGTELAHWDGATFSTKATPGGLTLYSLGGSAADDVWAVGLAGALAHRDATGWQAMDPGVGNTFLSGVWATTGEAWIVGNDDAILRRTH
jgi:hypothetical protein